GTRLSLRDAAQPPFSRTTLTPDLTLFKPVRWPSAFGRVDSGREGPNNRETNDAFIRSRRSGPPPLERAEKAGRGGGCRPLAPATRPPPSVSRPPGRGSRRRRP